MAKKKTAKKPVKSASKPAKKAKKPAPAKAKAVPAKQAKPAKKAAAAPKKAAAPAKPAKKVAAKAPAKPAAKAVAPKVKPEKVEAKKEKAAKTKAPKEEVEVAEPAVEEAAEAEEVVLTDAEGRRYCRVKDCDQLSAVDGYCRYHYLLYWKKIQIRKKILTEGKLERYIEELTARYPDKFLDMLRKDLKSEKEFLAAIQELEIDESAQEGEFEDETNYIEEVRGIGEPAGREEEDF